jgi:hypothetical protein
MLLLLEDQTTDTTGTQDVFSWKILGNITYGVVEALGTFDGCTVTLEMSTDMGTSWTEVGGYTTFVSAGKGLFRLPSGVQLRGSVTDAGASTEISLGLL